MEINQTEMPNLETVDGKTMLLNVDASGLKAIDWATRNRTTVEEIVQSNGALLIRGLEVHGSKQFSKLLSILFDSNLLQYNYRSTPRTELRGRVYTATEYPPGETIALHNENAYSNIWPKKLGFLCLVPPETGGETPICDSRLIYQKLPTGLRDKFEQKGILYVRNYSDIDLPWTEVFNTKDRNVVEAYCLENNLDYEWIGDNNLRTKQVNPAVITHPITGEKIWFNQAHLFHISNLGNEVSDTLIKSMGEENLPRNAYFGDGTPIEVEDLDIIRKTYVESKIKFQWEKFDLLLLDNLLFAHGREPFTGARKVLVGMA